jgi:hypothetical protein
MEVIMTNEFNFEINLPVIFPPFTEKGRNVISVGPDSDGSQHEALRVFATYRNREFACIHCEKECENLVDVRISKHKSQKSQRAYLISDNRKQLEGHWGDSLLPEDHRRSASVVP